MDDLSGFRIWEVDNKTRIPTEILHEDSLALDLELLNLDLENKTYAIRIGKTGLK